MYYEIWLRNSMLGECLGPFASTDEAWNNLIGAGGSIFDRYIFERMGWRLKNISYN